MTTQHGIGATAEREIKGNRGGARRLNSFEVDEIWKQVQERNRAAGPWGATTFNAAQRQK